jgi:hypothetical protein
MNLTELFDLQDLARHLAAKAEFYRKAGREDRVAEYLKELAEVEAKLAGM